MKRTYSEANLDDTATSATRHKKRRLKLGLEQRLDQAKSHPIDIHMHKMSLRVAPTLSLINELQQILRAGVSQKRIATECGFRYEATLEYLYNNVNVNMTLKLIDFKVLRVSSSESKIQSQSYLSVIITYLKVLIVRCLYSPTRLSQFMNGAERSKGWNSAEQKLKAWIRQYRTRQHYVVINTDGTYSCMIDCENVTANQAANAQELKSSTHAKSARSTSTGSCEPSETKYGNNGSYKRNSNIANFGKSHETRSRKEREENGFVPTQQMRHESHYVSTPSCAMYPTYYNEWSEYSILQVFECN